MQKTKERFAESGSSGFEGIPVCNMFAMPACTRLFGWYLY